VVTGRRRRSWDVGDPQVPRSLALNTHAILPAREAPPGWKDGELILSTVKVCGRSGCEGKKKQE